MSEDEFVVRDKRRFNSEGEVRPEATEEAHHDPPAEERASPSQKAPSGQREKTCAGPPPLPEINFPTFVFSLGTSVLMNLGEIPDPNTRESCRNLPLAKQTIDIMAMLQDKTKGNLTGEEESMLSNLLYELRMKYVSAVKAQ